ncbi:MAG: exosome complex RNA-binding protein Csl4 [Candidatus Bathyarchaeota archaeon]|nr:exosome complex RNA-binding protein Csl4 [Candidatus Bathyarchaeota archaeon]
MSKAKTIKKNVFPGDELAVIEEYNKGEGSYQQDGLVRSEELGETRLNKEKRALEVKKVTKPLNLPLEGIIVIAQVGSVTRRDARVDIFRVNGKKIAPTYTGVIHINDVSREFSRDLEQAIHSGDIVRAVVANTKNRIIQLSLAAPEYGVVYAYCSRCGGILENDKGRLTCPKCKRVERRQYAKSYGKEDISS